MIHFIYTEWKIKIINRHILKCHKDVQQNNALYLKHNVIFFLEKMIQVMIKCLFYKKKLEDTWTEKEGETFCDETFVGLTGSTSQLSNWALGSDALYALSFLALVAIVEIRNKQNHSDALPFELNLLRTHSFICYNVLLIRNCLIRILAVLILKWP